MYFIGGHIENNIHSDRGMVVEFLVLLDFSLTVKAAPHECVIRTS